ncbi:MAG: hypothetical protein K0R73_1445, partial [Candidatus Midichloriaceae bacterium]|nr:hypothetical protein [Candidatus Midichloriaceae bacterium]
QKHLTLLKLIHPRDDNQYYTELKRYADIELELELGAYENAALCYGVLAQSAPSEKEQAEAKKGIRAVEANIILNLPNSPENKVLEEIDSYAIIGDYFNMEPVLKKLERAGDLFLEAGRYEPATKIYYKLISLIQSLEQRGTKIADGLLELEKRVFIKLSHAFNGECVCIPVFYHKNKLEKIRKSLPDGIKGDLVKVQQNWNNDFEDLLKGIVREAEAQLGDIYKCAILSIGSLARREASLYSDVDLMIMTKDAIKGNTEGTEYFKALIDLIKVKIISLGEMLSLPAGVKEREVKGKIKLHYDIAGFFPSIERAICIGTAKELIEDVVIEHQHYQYQAAIQDSSLLNSGKEAKEIYQEYQEALTQRNKLAKASITEQLELETFKLEKEFSEIDIKNQILRYPVLLINRLFAYYNLHINNYDKSPTITEYKIDELVKESKRRNIDLDKLEGWEDFLLYCFSEERAKGLKRWLKLGYELRIKAHYLYGSSEDNSEVIYLDKGTGKVYLTNETGRHDICELEEFEELYEKEIKPIYRLVELWVKLIDAKTKEKLSEALRNESVQFLQEYEKTGNIEYAKQANWYYEKAVGFDLDGSEKAWIESIKELGEPARLTGYRLEIVGNNQSIIRLPLKEEIEKQYLHPNNHEIEGRRNVIKVNINGHYFHIKECPEAPGMEYAVSSLSHLLFGYTTTPFSTLAKLTKSNGETIPVLISRTVIGESLREALEEEPNFLDKSIDEESFGLSFIRTLLTSPHDDQAGNYVVPTILSPNSEKKLRLFCVDNDHGFLSTGIEQGWLQEEKCILKSILYCSGAINNELNAKVKSILLNLEPSILLKWLNKVDKRDIINRKLFKDAPRELKKDYKILKDGEAEIVVVEIPIYFGENLVQNLYFKLMQLQEIIEEDIENNYLSIFYKIDRVVAGHYIKMLGERIIGSNEVFDKKFAEQYTQKEKKDNTGKIIRYSTPNKPPVKRSVKLKEALTSLRKLFRKIKELPNIRNMMIEGKWPNTDLDLELKQMVINGRESKESSIFVDNIFEAINKKYNKIEALTRQRKVLEMIAYKGFFSAAFISDFRRLNLRGCEAIKNEDLKVVLPEGLEWLDITDCPNLTLNALDIIAEKCPNLETLYISDEITKRGYRRRQFDKLKKLSIEKCEAGNKKVFELANSCINLKKLQITNPSVHLINATKEGYLKIIRLFLEEGADVNEGYKEGKTLLMLAAENGKEEAAEFLLGNGADINAKDKDGNTALDLAFSSRKRNIGIIKLLCAKNPNAV